MPGIQFSSVTLASAAKAAYLFGAAETAFNAMWSVEAAEVLVPLWEELDGLQDRLGFAFYGPTEPEAVVAARRMIARRSANAEA